MSSKRRQIQEHRWQSISFERTTNKTWKVFLLWHFSFFYLKLLLVVHFDFQFQILSRVSFHSSFIAISPDDFEHDSILSQLDITSWSNLLWCRLWLDSLFLMLWVADATFALIFFFFQKWEKILEALKFCRVGNFNEIIV